MSKSGFYCQLHEVSKEGYGGDGPTHASFLSGACAVPVFWAAAPFLFTEILLIAWGSVASSRYVFFKREQHPTLPATTAILEEE